MKDVSILSVQSDSVKRIVARVKEDVAARFAASRLHLGPGQINTDNTRILATYALKSRNRGDFASALLSGGFYAKKLNQIMYLYQGNSYGKGVWRVSQKSNDYLSPINNTGSTVVSVTPELVVTYHDVLGRDD